MRFIIDQSLLDFEFLSETHKESNLGSPHTIQLGHQEWTVAASTSKTSKQLGYPNIIIQ
jgi:hypothetical protein